VFGSCGEEKHLLLPPDIEPRLPNLCHLSFIQNNRQSTRHSARSGQEAPYNPFHQITSSIIPTAGLWSHCPPPLSSKFVLY
jgi:hypothetical protein